MIFGGLEIVAAKYIGGKLLAAHAAHAAAAKTVFAVHHPLSTAQNLAAHHGLNSIMKNPDIHPAVKAALGQVLQHGATGATGTAGSAGTASATHAAARLAELTAMPVAARLVVGTDTYQNLKKHLSDQFGD
jgi:alpha-D-ribose 1-methylphosphonate 5-triphosphate synthase subunit PhnG